MKLPIAIAISVICFAFAIYQFLNIRKSEAVTGKLVGYDEQSNVDADGYYTESKHAIYEFYYHGKLMRYRSMVDKLPFVNDETQTLYVNEKGKVFEMKGVVCFMIIGAIALIVGLIL